MDRRPLTTADLPALHQTLNAVEAADDLPIRTPADDLEEQMTEEGLDLASDSLGLFDSAGACLAFGWARLRDQPSPEGRWSTITAAVHPEHTRQGHGAWLLDRLAERADEQLATAPPDPPRIVDAYVQASQVVAQRLLAGRGFTPMRFFDELTVDLAAATASAAPPEGIVLRPWDAARSQEAKGVHRGAFADHWGSSPITEQRWQRLTSEPRFQPDLSTIALWSPTGGSPDGGDVVVGMVLTTLWPDDWAAIGREEAWIDVVATARGHRGRGIARAMLARTLGEVRDRGLTHASLGVDSDSPTGAHRLYTSLGFSKTSQMQKWARPLDR